MSLKMFDYHILQVPTLPETDERFVIRILELNLALVKKASKRSALFKFEHATWKSALGPPNITRA